MNIQVFLLSLQILHTLWERWNHHHQNLAKFSKQNKWERNLP